MQCLSSFPLPYLCNMLILYTEDWTDFVDTEDLVHTAGFSSHGAD